jgi:hypothetical protein
MDDGLIDVRIPETGRRFSTRRVLAALAVGRLERSRLYHELQVQEFSFTAVQVRRWWPTMVRPELYAR